MQKFNLSLLILLPSFLQALATHKPSRQLEDIEAATCRTFFDIGGSYVSDGQGGHLFEGQMYVERLQPINSTTKRDPIVLIHGQAQTGTNFLNKPDGGTGWASRFIEQGHEVYIVDQTSRGRSAWGGRTGAGNLSAYNAELIQARFTAIQDSPVWPQARLHTQWPGPGVMGDPVFDAFYSSNVRFSSNATYQQLTMQAAGAALLDHIGQKTIVLGHSQGGLMPILIADARPELIKSLILIEPTGPPFQEAVFSTNAARKWGLTDVPLSYEPSVTDPETQLVKQVYPSPTQNSDNSTIPCILQAQDPAPRQLTNLKNLQILVVTSEASYHAPYDYCTVNYLRQAGCNRTEFLELPKIGIHGNGHMMFMEENSDDIQAQIASWIGGDGHWKSHR